MLITKPSSPAACQLFHDGILALSQVEAVGIRMNMEYLNRMDTEISAQIAEIEQQLKTATESRVWVEWFARFGTEANLGSREQLGQVLFDVMRYPYCGPPRAIEKSGDKFGRYTVDDAVLRNVNDPWVRTYQKLEKLNKLLGTYIRGVGRHVWGERLHASYNLHIARTFRSTSSDPNFQNIPVRDPVIGKIIRRAFIADEGHHLVEIDFSGIEVHGAAWYHKDPTMLHYLATGYDMHKEQASKCFCLHIDDILKPMRQAAKGDFVFSQFYGDWFAACAAALWESAGNLKFADGTTVLEHLKTVAGFTELGTVGTRRSVTPGSYTAHIKRVEHEFWNVTHPVYEKWREDHYAAYLETGGVDMLSGFRIEGEMTRNQCINYPVQGVAFHCLLWCLTTLQRLLEKHNMKSRIVGQIHDSILANVPAEELRKYVSLARHVMTKLLPQHYEFICTVVDVEAEVTPLGGNWADKETLK